MKGEQGAVEYNVVTDSLIEERLDDPKEDVENHKLGKHYVRDKYEELGAIPRVVYYMETSEPKRNRPVQNGCQAFYLVDTKIPEMFEREPLSIKYKVDPCYLSSVLPAQQLQEGVRSAKELSGRYYSRVPSTDSMKHDQSPTQRISDGVTRYQLLGPNSSLPGGKASLQTVPKLCHECPVIPE